MSEQPESRLPAGTSRLRKGLRCNPVSGYHDTDAERRTCRERLMSEFARFLAAPAALALMIAAPPSPAQQASPQPQASPAPSLDALLEQFDARAPEPRGSVRLDAWVETGDAGKEVVVMVVPEGDTKLVADPGITVTPAARMGVDWQLPLPLRLVDTERDYFDPPATVRLPFTSTDDQPLQLLVEYAYCFVDFQCFFGETELTVATATP